MAQDAGTVYAEIRLKLDKLQSEVLEVKQAFAQMGENVEKQNEKIAANIQSMTEKANTGAQSMTKKVNNALKGINKDGLKATLTAISASFLAVKSAVDIFIAAIGSVVSAINNVTQAYIEHHQEIAKIDTVLKATGASAWVTTRQVINAAKELASTAGRSTNEIMKMQAVLLGFDTIVGETFNRTSKVIVDMAGIMGDDLVSSANRVGKALDDPINGMSALSRVSIIFSDELKKQITLLQQSGQKMEAQNLILKQMEKFCEDVAVAMNDVNAAQSRLETATERLKVAQGEATSGIVMWWANVRAEWKEAAAEHREMINAANRFSASDYTKQIEQIEKLRDALKGAAEGWDKIVKEGELDLKELTARLDSLNGEIARNKEELLLLQRVTNPSAILMNQLFGTGNSRSDILKELIATQEQELKILEEQIEMQSELNAGTVLARNTELIALDNIEAVVEKMQEAEKQRLKTVEEIERARGVGLINDEQKRQQTQAAYQAEAAAINDALSLLDRLGEKNDTNTAVTDKYSTALTDLTAGLRRASNEFNNLAVAVEEGHKPLTPKQLHDYIDEVERTLRYARRAIQDDHDQGIDDADRYMERMLQAEQAAVNALTNFTQKHGVKWSENLGAWSRVSDVFDELSVKLKNMTTEQQKAAETKWIEEYQHKVDLLNAKQEERLQLETEYAVKRLKDTELYKNATEEVQAEMERLLRLSMQLKMEGNPFKQWVDGLSYTAHGMQELGDLFTALWKNANDEALRGIEERYKEEQKILEEFYDGKFKLMEQDYQNLLYYNGLAKATQQEHYEADMQKAIATGDHRLMYRAEQAKKEFEIRKKYEDDVRAEEDRQREAKERQEEEYRMRKARIELQAAMQQWGIQLALTTASVAQAIMQAYGQLGPIGGTVGAALMSGIGAAQVAAVIASKPQLKFDSGGIVDGSSFMGDKVLARVNSGEMVLNKRQQKNMFDAIDSGELKNDQLTPNVVHIHNTIELDGEVLAKYITETISNGNAFINSRGIFR